MLAEMLQRGIKWSQCWLGDREGIRVLNTLAAAPLLLKDFPRICEKRQPVENRRSAFFCKLFGKNGVGGDVE